MNITFLERPCCLFCLLYLFCHPILVRSQSTVQLHSSSNADTWVAVDGLRREVTVGGQGGTIRNDKYVGIFYFINGGASGYDKMEPVLPDEGVRPKAPYDTVSPYEITKLLAMDPVSPAFGPENAQHYWGEPYLGFYLPNDEWVIRKHAQMLSDAGVDVIVLDLSNGRTFLPQILKLADTYQKMRDEGKSTPQFTTLLNSSAGVIAGKLYDSIYAVNRYPDLWFYWQGKPLLLADPFSLTPALKSFFTIRKTWSHPTRTDLPWWGTGENKWSWIDHTPQTYGWHENPDVPEQLSVSAAEHPMTNVGRSYHNGSQPAIAQSNQGLFFQEQWDHALDVDPAFIFITGWNEWTARRMINGPGKTFMGAPVTHFLGDTLAHGETYFVDTYNEEFSRDVEPVKGYGHTMNDSYYYQMVDNIRKFKGSRNPVEYTESHTISIDGDFSDWANVEAVFLDDSADTKWRKHPGWGRIAEYANTTGRNDIVQVKIATDADYIAFYVKTAAPVSTWTSLDWMRLFIRVPGSTDPDWQGFHYMINGQPYASNATKIQRCTGGWNWDDVIGITYQVSGNEMELKINKTQIGILNQDEDFTIDFKWVDNAHGDGNPMHWIDRGDTAPNNRFAYRYIHKSP